MLSKSSIDLAQEMSKAFAIQHYGDFEMTQAVRPLLPGGVTPTEGYRFGQYEGSDSPFIRVSASRKKLWDLFHDLIDTTAQDAEDVHVVLETSHDTELSGDDHINMFRYAIESVVLKSYLEGYDDLLLDDGYTGIAVVDPDARRALQFDSHKMMILYGQEQHSFAHTLRRHGLPHRQEMRFISEGIHFHNSSDTFEEQFHALCGELNAEREETEE